MSKTHKKLNGASSRNPEHDLGKVSDEDGSMKNFESNPKPLCKRYY